MTRDYRLSPPHKKQYFQILLGGDAKIFYLDRVDNQVNNFTQTIQMIKNDYNSVVRLNKVKNYLREFHLNKLTREGQDKLESLKKI